MSKRKPKPTVFVVDDDEDVRDSLRFLIESAKLKVQAFASADEFLDAYEPDAPGCLVLDVRMPGMGGLELQQRLIDERALLPVIILTGHGDVPMSVRAMKAGAFQFLEKAGNDDDDLLEHIKGAIEHDENLRRRLAEVNETIKRIETLSPRELEVMEMVVAGMLNKQIATELNLAEKTVESHRGNVMKKMAAGSVVDLVRMVLSCQEARQR